MLIEPSKRVGSSTRAFEQRVLVARLHLTNKFFHIKHGVQTPRSDSRMKRLV
jgi:hypothetical protein